MSEKKNYTFALVFKSRDPQALNELTSRINSIIPDCFVVFRHGPSRFHLWVVEAKAPSRGEFMNEQKKNE